MPAPVNQNLSTQYQEFVDFANKAYATKGEDTVARFAKAPKGDFQGAFASLWRTTEMKSANDQVRDLFLQTIADMFGGEKYIAGAFRGDTASKLLSLYAAIGDGHFNQGVEPQTAMRLEDQATSHMMHIGVLKAAIDLAVDGQPGAALDPFPGELDADSIHGGDIFADLENLAAH